MVPPAITAPVVKMEGISAMRQSILLRTESIAYNRNAKGLAWHTSGKRSPPVSARLLGGPVHSMVSAGQLLPAPSMADKYVVFELHPHIIAKARTGCVSQYMNHQLGRNLGVMGNIMCPSSSSRGHYIKQKISTAFKPTATVIFSQSYRNIWNAYAYSYFKTRENSAFRLG